MGLTCGIAWAEDHHDVAVVDESGSVLAVRRIGVGAAGFADLLAMLAECGECVDEPMAVPSRVRSCSSLPRCSLPVGGYTPSIHWPFRGIAIGTALVELSRMRAMPSSWPLFFGPTRMRIGLSHRIATRSRQCEC